MVSMCLLNEGKQIDMRMKKKKTLAVAVLSKIRRGDMFGKPKPQFKEKGIYRVSEKEKKVHIHILIL